MHPVRTSLLVALTACSGGLTITPEAPTSADDLVASGADADAVVWLRDGVLTDRTGLVVPAAVTRRGDVWTATVPGPIVPPRADVTITNAPPAITIQAEPTATDRQPLEARVSVTDADDDPVTVDFTWRHGGEARTTDTPSLHPSRTTRGDTWVLQVTASDGHDTTVALTEFEVVNTPPRIDHFAIVPNPADATSALRAEFLVEDDDGDDLVPTYVWTLDGDQVQSGTNPVLEVATSRGQVVSVSGEVSDGFDVVRATDSLTIGNGAPQATVTVQPPMPTVASTLTCHVSDGFDPDGDAFSFTTLWQVNGQDISDAPTLAAPAFRRGDAVICVALGEDALGAVGASASEPRRIGNTAPTWSTPTFTPTPPTAAGPVTVDDVGLSDVDRDPTFPEVRWFVNGVDLGTAPALPAGAFARGDTLTASVDASDGDLWVGAQMLPGVVVANAVPTVTQAALWPPVAHAGTQVEALAVATDADGDPLTLAWSWWADGTPLPDTGPTLEVGDLPVGTQITARITASDGTDLGSADTAPITVVAGADDALWVDIQPASPLHRDDLSCGAWGDPDATLGQPALTWERDGVAVTQPATVPWRATTAGEVWTCTATWPSGLTTAAQVTIGQGPPGGNVLLVIADDLGVDKVAAYGMHPDPPPTPVINGLAAEGVRFNQAFAYPSCSPARAALLTGRYGRRTGIGRTVQTDMDDYVLPPDELGIPEVLRQSPAYRYHSAAIGKWHLTSHHAPNGLVHPGLYGFDTFVVMMSNIGGELLPNGGRQRSYWFWEENRNGTLSNRNTYATSAQANDAIEAMHTLPEPWFVWLAFTAPHTPTHAPPEHLHSFANLRPGSSQLEEYQAMVEAMDTELGRVLDSLDPEVRADTTIIFLGDNGTPSHATAPPFDPFRAKTTLYEGGTHVPFLVTGPHVQHPGSTVDALVHVVDVLPTLAEIAGVDVATLYGDGTTPGALALGPLDGHSLMPFLADPQAPGRDVVYTERFAPNGGPSPHNTDSLALRDARWRYLIDETGREALHDLVPQDYVTDGDDLLASPLSNEAQLAYDRLRQAARDHVDHFRATGAL